MDWFMLELKELIAKSDMNLLEAMAALEIVKLELFDEIKEGDDEDESEDA
jgi:hypothetical protein